MTTTFKDIQTDRARSEWESSLLAKAFLENTDFEPLHKKRLLKLWLPGSFNGAAFAADDGVLGAGVFEWQPVGEDMYILVWHAPYGISMPLARVYPQPNGTYASLVVAGVRDNIYEAMEAAEWAVSRLSSA